MNPQLRGPWQMIQLIDFQGAALENSCFYVIAHTHKFDIEKKKKRENHMIT